MNQLLRDEKRAKELISELFEMNICQGWTIDAAEEALELLVLRLVEARKQVIELRGCMAHLLNSRQALPSNEELQQRVRQGLKRTYRRGSVSEAQRFIDEEEAEVQHE